MKLLRSPSFGILGLVGFLAFAALLYGTASLAPAEPPTTRPVEGLRQYRNGCYALIGAKIVVAPGRTLDRATLVIRDGSITAVGPDAAIPGDAEEIDLSGKTLYPAWIDAYSDVSYGAPSSDAGYWNDNVSPHLNVADAYRSDGGLNDQLRRQGFGARLVAPADRIIKGRSALATTANDAATSAIVKHRVAQHFRLTVASRRGRGYPGSPMGATALVRQAFIDAAWHRDAWKAYRADTRLPRPENNDALSALADDMQSGATFIVDAQDELYALRADRMGREFGLNVIIRGSGDEYRRLDAVAAAGRTVIVPLNFPKAPNVSTPEYATDAPLDQLLAWDIAPENPGRLERSGVTILLTSHGLEKTDQFLGAVRKAIRRGLSPEGALRALTVAPAKAYGVDDRLGTLEAGKIASLIVADGDLLAEKGKIVETWVAGRRYRYDIPPENDVRGKWNLSLGKQKAEVEFSGEAKKLKGTIKLGDKSIDLKTASVDRSQLAISFDGGTIDRKGIVQVSLVLTGQSPEKTTGLGQVLWPNGETQQATIEQSDEKKNDEKKAEKKDDEKPKEPEAKTDDDKDKDDDKKQESDDAKKDDASDKKTEANKETEADKDKALFDVNYPLGPFGRTAAPERPKAVLFRNATVWTCGPRGIVEHASVLIEDGKIVAVGEDIPAPDGAIVVDARGMHLSPGVIDCHSHIATDGGINEGTQAITAEVRIGDFVNPDDVSIYRQLAGGVTAANILHGSANPIGGQNQVIKMRWGALDEEMKFVEAPPGIKFALGENVKQSNWSTPTGRYPQTRMGVEQLLTDAFHSAKAYQQQWERWNRDKQGLPPRRDLQLETIGEILDGKRWIHCHSYRQDEILATMRTLELFNVRIGTFQHILEGYKVADEMARHGAMGSAFSDWWAYKFEVYDAIPYAGALMHDAGVVVSFNSDDAEMGRRLNLEAAKAMKYGGVPAEEALKFVTLNPARQLRIDQYVGSIEPGKQADLVLWSESPLSTFTRCEQTWVDGRKYFDREEDLAQRDHWRQMHAALVQRVLTSKADMLKPGERNVRYRDLWKKYDEYCLARGDGSLRRRGEDDQQSNDRGVQVER